MAHEEDSARGRSLRERADAAMARGAEDEHVELDATHERAFSLIDELDGLMREMTYETLTGSSNVGAQFQRYFIHARHMVVVHQQYENRKSAR